MTDPDEARREINRRKNASLVQSRVPLALRLALLRQARRRGLSVSALVAAILADHFSIAPDKARG